MPTQLKTAANGSAYAEVTPDDGLDVAVHYVRRFAHMAVRQLRRVGPRYQVKNMAAGAVLLGQSARLVMGASGLERRVTNSPWIIGSAGTIVSDGERARKLTVISSTSPDAGSGSALRRSKPRLLVDNTAPTPEEPEWISLLRWWTERAPA